MAAKKPPSGDSQLVAEVMAGYENDKKSHDAFLQKCEDRYKAYRGILDVKSEAAQWTSKQHPPLIFEIVEVMVSTAVDTRLRWPVKPRPRMASPEEVQQLRDGARANELLLAQQADTDRLSQKQVVFDKQGFICGLTAYKTFWRYGERLGKRQVRSDQEIAPGISIPKIRTEDHVRVLHDDNSCEVVDVRDLVWHEAAISLEKALRVTHRVLHSMDELRQLEAAGVYRNVGELVESRISDPAVYQREQDLFEVDRGKDMVEVLEQWRRTKDGMRVTAVGNGNVLLRDDPNPFWHGEFPFVVCGAIPDMFRIPGISVVEQIAPLQQIAWTLLNQRLDNLSLLNNAIVLIADDSEDWDQFEWAPGAQWLVPRPIKENVATLEVSPLPAQISLEAESRIRSDLQNIPGANPTLQGQIDQPNTTATEVSTATNLALRRVALTKQMFRYAHRDLGLQWLENNQQFVREDRLLAVVGPGGADAFHRISPEVLQGEYAIDLEAMDESLIQQERQAQATSRFQIALQAAPVFAALSQAGHTPMLNLKAFMDDVLDAGDISDKDRYFTAAAAPPMPQQGQGGGQQPSQPGQPPQGVSAPEASDMSSPSNSFSQSPVAANQRLLALTGGAQNQ